MNLFPFTYFADLSINVAR